jgi:thiamine phosphate synthase YjbQ (UPF0047 family)
MSPQATPCCSLLIEKLLIDRGWPWEQIFYGEFDGQRKKRIVVKVMGE